MSGFVVNPRDGSVFMRNTIMNGSLREHRTDEFEGTLSVKSVISGRATWVTDEGRYPVDEESYLVLNEGQKYRLLIRSPEPTETFCVFFRPSYLRGVMDARAQTIDEALAGYEESPNPGFYERLSLHDASVTPVLRRMAQHVKAGDRDPLYEEDLMTALAEGLSSAHFEAQRQVDALDAARAATREELYLRLRRARDYMIAHYDSPVDLKQAAKVACLSPYHFHRLFRRAFGMTPHEFLVEQRLARAKRLLTSGRGVAETCYSVGFESVASFCTLFKRRVGVTPGSFRG